MNFNGRHLPRRDVPNHGLPHGDQLARVLGRRPDMMASAAGMAQLCELSVGVVAMSGASIVVMTGEAAVGSLGTTNEVSALLEDLEYTLGEGPGVDAHRGHRPIGEPDLIDPLVARWMAFTPAAVEAGARAVFGFPLTIGRVHLGVLSLYRDRPGPMSARQHDDAVVMAGVAAHAVIGMQAAAPPGALGTELELGANFQWVVHQASGMVAAQLDASVSDALVCLRAHAFSHGQLVADVARDVVARRLRFTD